MTLPHVIALLASLSFEPPTVGNTAAVLRGVVRDQQGGAVAGATIDISCGAEHRRATTDAAGEFSASGLPVAVCTVTAEATLFETARTSVDLTPGGATTTLVLRVRRFVTELVVTPTRGMEEETFDVPESISVATRAQFESRPYHLLPQVLREEPGILVQQTTSAHASPIIRGFTGQSNVYLVDGVRFNTGSWRVGPSQYLAWIDGAAVDRLEIVRGPSSVQYGSDALGGTINFLTARPAFGLAKTLVSGDVQAFVGSADRSAGGQADLQVQGPLVAFRVGGSMRHVEDLRAGGGIDSHAAVTRFLGLPSSAIGTRLKDTAFEQSGGYIVGNIRAGAKGIINTVYMHDNLTGSSRYDRIYGGDGLYRSGFDPQRLDFGLVRYRRGAVAGFDELSGTFSLNRQADGRFEQVRPTAVLDRQEGTTTAYGYQVQAHRRVGSRQHVNAGTEIYDELTAAFREQVNPVTGAVTAQRPDIPNGTKYTNFGVFAQDVVDVVPGRLTVRGGLRYGRFRFSTEADPTLGVVDEQVTTRAVTFQAGAVINLTKNVNATFNVSRGFRAANASDLGTIGLSGGGGGGLFVAPSRAAVAGGLVGSTVGADAVSTGRTIPALGPESLYAYESGLKVKAGRFSASVTGYDVEYLDTIQRRAIVFPTNIVGTTISGYEIVRQDAAGLAYIVQDVRPIGTSVNLDRARILGLEADGHVRLADRWTAAAYFSMSNGHLLSTGEYLRRMSPPLGGARVRWSGDRTWVEGAVSFAASQTRFNTGDLTDARIGAARTRTSIASYFNGTATDLGLVESGVLRATGETLARLQNRLLGSATSAPLFGEAPGSVVLGVRTGWRISPQVDVTVIGENLADRNYRLYGSGVDAPGINVQVKTRYRF